MAYVSVFEVLRAGPGPSSAHTVGPLVAAQRFVHDLSADGVAAATARVEVELYGGLACAGRDAGAAQAIVAGLAGKSQSAFDAAALAACHAQVDADGAIALGGRHRIGFVPGRDIAFRVDRSPGIGGNALRFVARDAHGGPLASRWYLSIGDGEVIAETERGIARQGPRVPFPFASADELLAVTQAQGKKIAVLALANEAGQKSPGEVRAALTYLGAVMRASVERGLSSDTLLPGAITRRAGAQADALHAAGGTPVQWCTVFATAVGEENACGGRVVAAPTSGAAGPVAALLVHWRESTPMATDEGVVDFLLTAGTIGGLLRASGLRQAGCQSAVGVAAAMAAAGYAAVQGASNRQVLRAAELALEPHLGLACDPVGGRVQQPCIERNAAGAARAYAAAEAAIHHPDPRSALDSLTRSMIESGRGMTQRYKEASISNAPVNIAEC